MSLTIPHIDPGQSKGKQEDPLFTEAVIHLFEGKNAGHLGKWEYSSPQFSNDPVNGVRLWSEFIAANPQYYIPETEIALAQKARDAIPRIIKEPVSMAFLGIGNVEVFEAKDLTVTSRFNQVAGAFAFDINPDYANAANAKLAERWPKERVSKGGIVCDMFNGFNVPENHDPYFSSRTITNVATLFGLTLFNLGGFEHDGFPEKKILDRLAAIKRAIGKKGFFITTHDANQDSNKVEAAYANQGAFACNLAARINRDTPYAVKVSKTQFHVKYHPESGLLAHYLELHHDPAGGGQMTFEDGVYHINSSWKISDEAFNALLTHGRNGSRLQVVERFEENGIFLKVLQSGPG